MRLAFIFQATMISTQSSNGSGRLLIPSIMNSDSDFFRYSALHLIFYEAELDKFGTLYACKGFYGSLSTLHLIIVFIVEIMKVV